MQAGARNLNACASAVSPELSPQLPHFRCIDLPAGTEEFSTLSEATQSLSGRLGVQSQPAWFGLWLHSVCSSAALQKDGNTAELQVSKLILISQFPELNCPFSGVGALDTAIMFLRL